MLLLFDSSTNGNSEVLDSGGLADECWVAATTQGSELM